MNRKMDSQYLLMIAVFLIAALLHGCGLFGQRGSASEKANRRGEVTGVPNRSVWQQTLAHEMVPVRARTFWMGQADEDISQSQTALNKQITISEFFMDKYEVSNNKYRQFLEAVRMGELTTGPPTTLDEPPQFNIDELLPDTAV